MRPVFTAEELAAMRAADAEIEASFRLSPDERRAGNARDRRVKLDRSYGREEAQRAYYEANREKIAEAKRAYREANREKIAEAKRAYREANREKIAEAQRAYYEANREKIAEAQRENLRHYRLCRNMSQTVLGEIIGVSQRTISYWETGSVPMDEELLCSKLPDYIPFDLEAAI